MLRARNKRQLPQSALNVAHRNRPALSGGMDWWRMEWPFSRVRKIFFRDRISWKIPEIPQKERFSPKFRFRNFKIQSPKNAIPYAQPFHTPTGLPPKKVLMHKNSGAPKSGHVRPRLEAEICNFGAPSPLDFLKFLQLIFLLFL